MTKTNMSDDNRDRRNERQKITFFVSRYICVSSVTCAPAVENWQICRPVSVLFLIHSETGRLTDRWTYRQTDRQKGELQRQKQRK